MKIKRNVKIVTDADLQLLFDEFEAMSSVVDGGLSFTSLSDFDRFSDILPDAFVVSPPLQRLEKIRLFGLALHQARRQGSLTADAIVGCATEIHQKTQATARRKYTLWTKIRANWGPETRAFSFNFDGVTARVSSKLPKWLRLDKFRHAGLGAIDPAWPDSSSYVILDCLERHGEDAVGRMIDALKIFMGLANFYKNHGRKTFMHAGRWSAGDLWLGPYQFLYCDDLHLNSEGFWYNPEFHSTTWVQKCLSINEYKGVIPYVKENMLLLSKHPLKDILQTSILLMQDGFEAQNGNTRLLKFWAGLEKLYVEDSTRDRSNQKVIDRSVFADDEYRLARWELTHISRLRNEYVHSRGNQDDYLRLSQSLRDRLGSHILHWLNYGKKFRNHQDLLDFVDLPRDDDALIAKRSLLDQRLKFNKLLSA